MSKEDDKFIQATDISFTKNLLRICLMSGAWPGWVTRAESLSLTTVGEMSVHTSQILLEH